MIADGRRRRTDGFTLLELVVAIALFAIVTALTYGGMRYVLNARSGLLDSMQRFEQARDAIVALEQDLSHAVNRGVRDEFGDPEPPLKSGIDGVLLDLTRSADIAPGEFRPRLKRIRYRFEGSVLFRDVWDRLDRTQATAFRSRRLTGDAAGLRLRFFSGGEWTEFWPGSGDTQKVTHLPRAVEIVLEFDPGRSARRLVLIPGWS